MKVGTIVKVSFVLSLILVIVGALLKILHYRDLETLLVVGVVLGLIFIVSSLYEVRTSKRINSSEKTLWTIAFIFMSGITGLVYIISGRRKVVGD